MDDKEKELTGEEKNADTETVLENSNEETAEASEPETLSEQAEKKENTKPEKKKKKDKLQEQIEELNDKLLRNRAEFDNYRKRTEKEKLQMYEVGAKDIVEKILPTIDNFERGLASVPDDEALKSFKEGIEMIYRQFMSTLDEIGVKPIEAVGQPFDPELHNAVMHVEDEAFGENIVAEEFQKGYTYHDKVLRYSMVKVAN